MDDGPGHRAVKSLSGSHTLQVMEPAALMGMFGVMGQVEGPLTTSWALVGTSCISCSAHNSPESRVAAQDLRIQRDPVTCSGAGWEAVGECKPLTIPEQMDLSITGPLGAGAVFPWSLPPAPTGTDCGVRILAVFTAYTLPGSPANGSSPISGVTVKPFPWTRASCW